METDYFHNFVLFAGILILNLVCRDEEMRRNVLKQLTQTFDKVFVKDIDEEVNQIVYAINRNDESECDKVTRDYKNLLEDKEISQYLSSCVKGSSVDLNDQFQNMVIIDR